jgi:phage gp46-like protein
MAGFNFRVSPETHDYELDAAGGLVRDYTAQTSLVLQLLDERGRWWGDLRLGSNIAASFRGQPPSNPPSALRAAIVEALQPLVRARRLRTFSVAIDEGSTPLRATITAVDGDSQPVQLTLQPVG